MERSVLFFDIDGTLLSEITGKIPESAKEALAAARRNGHRLFINTGRTVSSIPAEIGRLSFDGFLCGCGTTVIYKDEEIFSRHLSEERGRELIEKLRECSLGAVAEGPEDVYFPGYITRFDSLETTRRYFREKGMGLEKTLEYGGFVYDKLLVYADGNSDLEGFLRFADADMETIDRGGSVYEVVQKNYSKATACEYVLNMLEIPKERAYVFGDSSNDLSMFEYADHAVAMGKHDAVLEPHTEFITRAVEDDGIAHALKYYGLI